MRLIPRISPAKITEKLQTKVIGHTLYYLDTIDSTNSECRRRSASENEGMVILSEQQTAGKGRMGRIWVSPEGKGIWMSLLLKPTLPSDMIPQLTLIGAAALCLAVEKIETNLKNKVTIKWPNDIVIQGKKVGGILTEMQMSGGKVESVVLGIGLNVNLLSTDFPEPLTSLATSLFLETGKTIQREALVAEILNSFEKLYVQFLEEGNLGKSLAICRQRSSVIGKTVQLLEKGVENQAEVLDLGPRGELIVKWDNGEITPIVSGEVSLRTP